jgi:SAM-dependent methyltransferase
MRRPVHEQTAASVRADFDRIALLPDGEGWDSNRQYHRWLLRRVPPGCGEALDVGCGLGGFARLLARRCRRVVGIDLSPAMVAEARRRSEGVANAEFRVADLMAAPLEAERYDCVASIATLHHLPLEAALERLRGAVRPGGVLLVLDLVRPVPGSLLVDAAAVPVAVGLRLCHSGRVRPSRDAREAWDAHARGDRYLSVAEVRQTCAAVLPGARVRRHLLWRCSIVWRRP